MFAPYQIAIKLDWVFSLILPEHDKPVILNGKQVPTGKQKKEWENKQHKTFNRLQAYNFFSLSHSLDLLISFSHSDETFSVLCSYFAVGFC